MAREKGVSNLLNAYPLKEYGFDLSKQQFWDGISIRYVWPFSNYQRHVHAARCTLSNKV